MCSICWRIGIYAVYYVRLWWSRMRLKFWQSRATGGWKTASLSDWQARLDLLFSMGQGFKKKMFLWSTVCYQHFHNSYWPGQFTQKVIKLWKLIDQMLTPSTKSKKYEKVSLYATSNWNFFVNSIDCSSAWSGQRQYHSYHGAAFGSKGLRHLQVNNTVIIRFSDWFHLKLNIPLLKSFSF